MSRKQVVSIAVTGHRPKDLFGYESYSAYHVNATGHYKLLYDKLYKHMKAAIVINGAREFISGMALGVDSIFFDVACTLREEFKPQGIEIQVIACIPFVGQTNTWNALDVKRYRDRLSRSDTVVVVDKLPGYEAVQLTERIGKGGTAHCIGYAEKKGLPVFRINPAELIKKAVK